MRTDGASGGGAGATVPAISTVDLTGFRPSALRIDLEGRLEVELGEARVVGAHPAEIPELAADFSELVRLRALEHDADRSGFVDQTQLAHAAPFELAHDYDLVEVVETRIGEKCRNVRRAALWRLRGDRRDQQAQDD